MKRRISILIGLLLLFVMAICGCSKKEEEISRKTTGSSYQTDLDDGDNLEADAEAQTENAASQDAVETDTNKSPVSNVAVQQAAAEEAARQKAAAEEAARQQAAAEEAARQQAAAEEATRQQAAAEEAARQQAAAEEAARQQAAEEAARQQAAEEAARQKAAEEAARQQAAAEEAARQQAAAEEAARKKAEEEARKKAEEEERKKAEALQQQQQAQQQPVQLSGEVKRVVELVNEQRAANGLGALSTFSTLQQMANVRAAELVQTFSHSRPNGTTCFTVFDEYNVAYWAVGENIAAGQKTAEDVMNSWMNSEGHRANILSGEFTHIGVGRYEYGGKIYWVQLFCKPQ